MITVTDLFCGAGGSSTGLSAIPGVEVKHAANHWKLAIETHNTNHPNTDHSCADISQVDPRYFPRTDILWASPECTNHSVARGKKQEDSTPDLFGDRLPDEAAERSRATMWDVPRFAEVHRYRAIIIENVVDAANWTPFPAWLMAMDTLGYEHEKVFMNSMHAQAAGDPAPQSRDRMYVVFWRKGNRRPDLEKWTRPAAHCPTCGPIRAVQSWKRPDRPAWGRYRAQYVWRCPNVACRNSVVEPGWLPAAAAIDWALPAQRIGDRAKPLAPKTMARIEAGIRKYWSPFTAEVAGNTFERRPGVRTWSTKDVLRTLHTTPSKALLVPAGGTWRDTATELGDPMPARTTVETDGLLVPVEGREGKSAAHLVEPLRTMTTRNETGVLIPLRANNTPKSAVDPFDTFAAAGNHHALITRHFSTPAGGEGYLSKPATEPLGTLTTSGQQSLTTAAFEGTASVSVSVEDCLFRMLAPHEIAAGMAFPKDYVILGNKREQVRQAGNAVCPPNARDLGHAVVESLVGAV